MFMLLYLLNVIYLNHEYYMFTEWNKLYFIQNSIHVLLRKSIMLNLKFMYDSYLTDMKAFVIVFHLCIPAQTELVFFFSFQPFYTSKIYSQFLSPFFKITDHEVIYQNWNITLHIHMVSTHHFWMGDFKFPYIMGLATGFQLGNYGTINIIIK
jgi:hypothetical protein